MYVKRKMKPRHFDGHVTFPETLSAESPRRARVS